MGWTKQQVIDAAYEEIGYASYNFDIQAEQYESALNRMDAMVSSWLNKNLVLTYPIPTAYGGSDLAEDTDMDGYEEALFLNLALRLAPMVGKEASRQTKANAAQAFRQLQVDVTVQSETCLPSNLPVGAGNKPFRGGLTGEEFFSGTTS